MNVPPSRTASAARLGVLGLRGERPCPTNFPPRRRVPRRFPREVTTSHPSSGRFQRMRAATVRDGEIVVEDHPEPTPGHGEVLIAVRAAALNGADMMQKRGLYPAPAGWPQDIPGLDVAGEVVALGRAPRVSPGDRVMALRRRWRPGRAGSRPRAAADARPRHPRLAARPAVPRGPHHRLRRALHAGQPASRRAAARPRRRRRRRHGRRAARRGHRRRGHRPVRNPASATAVAALGAHQVIEPEGFGAHGPFDVILGLVGAPNLAENVKALNTLGRIVVIGISGGAKAELNLGALMGKRGRSAPRRCARARWRRRRSLARAVERHVLPLFARGARRHPDRRDLRPETRRPPTSASPPAASSARSS